MKTERLISIRPVRHAYFIREDDVERFNEVASFCCTQWGGINNLIIPITIEQDASWAISQMKRALEDLLEKRRPDIFVDAVSDKVNKEISSQFYSNLTGVFTRKYYAQSFTIWETLIQKDRSLGVLAFPPIWQRGSQSTLFGAAPDAGTQAPLSVAKFDQNITPPPLEQAVITAAFGWFWPKIRVLFESLYIPQVWSVSLVDWLIDQQLSLAPWASLINLTLRDLELHYSEKDTPIYRPFAVVIAQSVTDLCLYWNMRAQAFGIPLQNDRRILILSRDQFLKNKALFDYLLKKIREHMPRSRMGPPLDVVFHYKADDQEIETALRSRNELIFQKDLAAGKLTLLSENAGTVPTSNSIVYDVNTVQQAHAYLESAGKRAELWIDLAEGGKNALLLPEVGPSNLLGAEEVVLSFFSSFWNSYPSHVNVKGILSRAMLEN